MLACKTKSVVVPDRRKVIVFDAFVLCTKYIFCVAGTVTTQLALAPVKTRDACLAWLSACACGPSPVVNVTAVLLPVSTLKHPRLSVQLIV